MSSRFFLTICAVLVMTTASCKKKTADSRTASDSDAPATSSPIDGDQMLPAKTQAAKLVLIGADMAQAASACGPLIVQVEDNDGFGAIVDAEVSVNLSASAATGAFYSDEACATAVTSIKIASGSSEAQVFYKDTAVGTTTLTAADAKAEGGLTAASGNLLIDVITKLAFLDSTLTQAVNNCNGYLVVEAQGSGSAAVRTAAEVIINVSSSASTGQFFSDEGCTTAATSMKISQGSSESVPIYYKDSAVGTPTITATEAPTQGWTAATVAASITAN